VRVTWVCSRGCRCACDLGVRACVLLRWRLAWLHHSTPDRLRAGYWPVFMRVPVRSMWSRSGRCG